MASVTVEPARKPAVPLPATIQLVVVQPTPFCNIQCEYCYLPNKDSTARLEPPIFRELLTKVFASGLAGDQISLVWHAGEPLALPVSYYSTLFDAIDAASIPRRRVQHSMQTNAMLLSDTWCEFILANRIKIGVSVDGPAFLNDRHRKDRQGKGTHNRVMKGIEFLRKHGIEFHVIAVVTADSLNYPDEIFEFFLDLGVKKVGFNVEELEGRHKTSTLLKPSLDRVRMFWSRLYELREKNSGRVSIREFENATERIAYGPERMDVDQAIRMNSQVAPFGIISVDWQGNISSFSPELLGLKSLRYGDFSFGNVGSGELLDLRNNATFVEISEDIRAGVERCHRTCEYFSLCGGGAPSNKYFENGSFDSAETMYCRTSIQAPVDVVLADLERKLKLQPSGTLYKTAG